MILPERERYRRQLVVRDCLLRECSKATYWDREVSSREVSRALFRVLCAFVVSLFVGRNHHGDKENTEMGTE
jgi:hypothetical protein